MAQLADLGLDGGIAFVLAVFFLDLLLGHAVARHEPHALPEIIQPGDNGQRRQRRHQHLEQEVGHVADHRGGRLIENGFQPAALRPKLSPDRHPDNTDLCQSLEQVHPAFHAEHALEAGQGRHFREIRHDLVEGNAGTALQHMTGKTRRNHYREERRQHLGDLRQQGAQHRRKAGAIHAHGIGLLQEHTQRTRQSHGGIFAEHGDRQGAAAQQNKSRELGGFDDIAIFARLLEPFLCRLFGLLRLVLVFRHNLIACRRHHRNTAMELA